LFVTALEKLGPDALSLLRRSTGLSLAESVAAFDLFTDIYWPLRERDRGLSRQACWRVATLYPWHPQPHGTGDLGLCLAWLVPLGHSDSDRRARDREERRFETLLTADNAALDTALHYAVRRLARREIPIDWRQLLEDLTVWRSPDQMIQNKWATSYNRLTKRGEIHAH
jgi:CRISPR type I-E-associated protein CasB/Cse2